MKKTIVFSAMIVLVTAASQSAHALQIELKKDSEASTQSENRTAQTDESAVQSLFDVEAKRRQALIDGDADALEPLLGDDFIEITGRGVVRRKVDNLNDLRSGRLRITRADASDQSVHLFGPVAIYSAVYQAAGTMGGRPFGGITRISRTYLERDGHWVCIYAQGTRLEEAGNQEHTAQQATSTGKTVTTNLIRNDQVHVSRTTHAPRQNVRMHYAPPMTLVFLTDAHFAWLWPDGKREEVSYKAGDAAWFPGGLRASESLDDQDQQIMIVVPVSDPNPERPQGDPFVGRFKAASHVSTVQFSRDGEWLVANVSKESAGEEMRGFSYRAKFDGKEYPYTSPADRKSTISLERRTRNVIVQTERLDGRVIFVHTYVLSADGKSIDHARLMIDPAGKETSSVETLSRE